MTDALRPTPGPAERPSTHGKRINPPPWVTAAPQLRPAPVPRVPHSVGHIKHVTIVLLLLLFQSSTSIYQTKLVKK